MAAAHERGGGDRVVYRGPREVGIERMESPPPVGPGEVLVRVEACAICGTDVKSFHKGNPRIKPPMTMGHEFVGAVEAVGEGAPAPRPGARVVMATTIGCGECGSCRAGRSNLCRAAEAIGFHYPGAMAPWVVIPARAVRLGHLVEVGDLAAPVAALAEPLSCVVNGLARLPLRQIRTALVIGLGPLGLLHALAARARGVERTVCSQAPGVRADLARALGFAEIVPPAELDAACGELTRGEGFDLVVVTAPDRAVQSRSPAYARKGGWVSLFASLPPADELLSVSSRAIHYGELFVFGTSDSTPAHVREAVALLRDDPETFEKLVTHRLPVCEFARAMDEIAARRAVKVVLTP
ncbi:MAG TPA: alcohol dehydrogenase catalytic domain-containing protein [Anaeromyxobacteraceae bacterium]|nr:alcohol dehydrogenase catalytic domain-containing protein [Anaeromyxobacteraceae bacterium]